MTGELSLGPSYKQLILGLLDASLKECFVQAEQAFDFRLTLTPAGV
jgi:hypothetical protein